MAEIVVTARSRTETGKSANHRLRAQGLIPGVVYGASRETAAVAVSPKDIAAILKSASGENTLFELELHGVRCKVILKDYHVEPVRHHLLHADFYEVALDKRLTVMVHVELQGTPVGVKTQGGLLDFVTRELEVECLPTDIPEKIVVDVSELMLGKHVRVSDLQAPPGVAILTDPDVVLAHVVTPRAEVAAEAAPAAAAPAETAAVPTAEPEVIKKGKGEEGEKPEKGERGEKREKK